MLDISKYDAKSLKSEAAIIKAAAEIGTGNLTDLSVFERFAAFMFAVGVAHRQNKVNGDIDTAKIFDAFNTPFRSGEGSMRKELSENSVKTWASAFGAFADAGRFAAYDMSDIVEKATKLDKQSYTVRGAKVRKVMDKHPTTKPNDVELDAILNPVSKADENPALTLAKRWLSTTSDERVAKSDKVALEAIKAKPRQRIAMLAVVQACEAFVKACEVADGETGLSAADEMAQLKAQLEGSAQSQSVN